MPVAMSTYASCLNFPSVSADSLRFVRLNGSAVVHLRATEDQAAFGDRGRGGGGQRGARFEKIEGGCVGGPIRKHQIAGTCATMQDIGVFLKTEIVRYCKQKGLFATLKYIDPAYMIRTVPANSYDRKLCAHLASSAVHGAMAGYTAFTVGHINQYVAMIPISALGKPNRITKSNRSWQRVLAYTGQPSFQN